MGKSRQSFVVSAFLDGAASLERTAFISCRPLSLQQMVRGECKKNAPASTNMSEASVSACKKVVMQTAGLGASHHLADLTRLSAETTPPVDNSLCLSFASQFPALPLCLASYSKLPVVPFQRRFKRRSIPHSSSRPISSPRAVRPRAKHVSQS
jgi:hypothetical protein